MLAALPRNTARKAPMMKVGLKMWFWKVKSARPM
uniref:Uncharacterized protein n=1 Tax=Anguilla anguilla TaxID=7936 RepID=A0A0E9TUH0_ANGAN